MADGTPDYKGNLTPGSDGVGTVDREHAYLTQGDYTVILTVTDNRWRHRLRGR